MEKKVRYDWVDFMRGIMMCMVVLYHSEVYYYNTHTWSWVFEPVFLSGFFFVSGFLFTKQIESVSWKSKCRQVLRGIVLPYFFFVLLLAIPKIWIGHVSLRQSLIDIVMMRASWFVVTIGVLQLLYAGILRYTSSIRMISFCTLGMFLIGYGFVVMYRNCPVWILQNPWLHSVELPNRLPLCINLALVQSPFFLLGILFRRYEDHPWVCNLIGGGYKRMIINLILYIGLYLLIDYNYIGSRMCVAVDSYTNILLIYGYALLGIFALTNLSKIVQLWKPMNYIGQYSIVFYFLNGAALTLVSALAKSIPQVSPESYINQIIVAIIATLLIFPCVWFINRYLPILTGNKDSFNRISSKLGLKIKW